MRATRSFVCYTDAMADLRLPLAQARERGLLPDLAPICEQIKHAALELNGELIEDNPRLAVVDPLGPDHRHREMTPAQRALAGVYFIHERVPPWEWLSLLLDDDWTLPWIIWSGREVGIGKTGDYIEHLVRIAGGDPETLVAAYRAAPSSVLRDACAWKRPWFGLPWDATRGQAYEWWRSDEGRADFNARVFDFALRRLPELIALDEQVEGN
jgi:hypothetical protein